MSCDMGVGILADLLCSKHCNSMWEYKWNKIIIKIQNKLFDF